MAKKHTRKTRSITGGGAKNPGNTQPLSLPTKSLNSGQTDFLNVIRKNTPEVWKKYAKNARKAKGSSKGK